MSEAEDITRFTRYEDLPELLTLDEVRIWLGIGKSTLYNLVSQGKIPTRRFGQRYFISKKFLNPDVAA
ncbi:MAG: helix-turn-helix domain-containing protein [Acidobacteriota bacterium]